MILGLVLKYRKGERFVIRQGSAEALPSRQESSPNTAFQIDPDQKLNEKPR
jgi:hypothetical protein